MDTHDALEIGAMARQFEHDRAAEAEADGAHPVGIDLGQRGERREGGSGACPQLCRVVAKLSDQCARLLWIAGLSAIAKHVGSHGDLTQPRDHAGALHGMLIEPQPLVHDEDAWPPVSCHLIVGKKSKEACRLVVVVDVPC